MSKNVIIIGAGVGGMAAAIRLARKGWKVKVLEKNTRVGGRLDCHASHGFLWDTGPTLITMPFVLRDLFDIAGHDLEHYLDLIPLDPVCRYFFPDGKIMNTWSNAHLFEIEFARREKDHGEALERYIRYAGSLFKMAWETHLNPPPSSGKKLEKLARSSRHAFRLPGAFGGGSMARSIEKHFKDPHARQLFSHYAAQQGSSPYDASVMANILPYTEMHDGGWYVQGGVYRLAEALERCARDVGVEFLFDAEVSEISLKKQGTFRKPRATGIIIRGGIEMKADLILCNADVMHAWTRLLHTKKQAAVARRLDRRPFSSSEFTLLMGVKGRNKKLAHHNVFFSSNPTVEFNDVFHKKRMASEPTITLTISGRSDPTQSPSDHDNYAINIQTPSLEPDHHWETLRDTCRKTILDRLAKMGLEIPEKDVVYEKIITPADFAARTHAYRGATHGHALRSTRSILGRPPNRSEEVEGLYFAGNTTLPGGGIPFVLLSAQRACRMIEEDQE